MITDLPRLQKEFPACLSATASSVLNFVFLQLNPKRTDDSVALFIRTGPLLVATAVMVSQDFIELSCLLARS